MSKIGTFIHLIFHDRQKIKGAIARNFANSKLSHIVSDKTYLKYMYRVHFGKKLNLKDPKTFNEKLNWLKLYNRDPKQIKLVDKYEVKKYIADTIGEEYVIPTLGVYDSFDEIDFDALPERFVLKCTHDSGSTVICRDKAKFDVEAARKKLTRKLGMNLFWHGREWPYKVVKPRIIAETYITFDGDAPEDYKFFCFDGDVKCFKVDYDRFKGHRANYYTPDGELMRFGEVVCLPDFERDIKMPKMKDEMISLAKRLSVGHPFLRVDFYELDKKIYFGELTFYPASGFGPFTPEEWDTKLGEWIKLPSKTK